MGKQILKELAEHAKNRRELYDAYTACIGKKLSAKEDNALCQEIDALMAKVARRRVRTSQMSMNQKIEALAEMMKEASHLANAKVEVKIRKRDLCLEEILTEEQEALKGRYVSVERTSHSKVKLFVKSNSGKEEELVISDINTMSYMAIFSE